MKKATIKNETLTIKNAHKVSTIISKTNPEWGTKRFEHNSVELDDERRASSFGSGCNSAVLFEGEYKFWNVSSWMPVERWIAETPA